MSSYDVTYSQGGIDNLSATGNVLRVRTMAQKLLFDEELKGQISDGAWEHVDGDHWIAWCDTTVVVDPTNLGRNFHAIKDNYNLNNKFLMDCVGDRMVAHVQANGFPEFTMEQMLLELRDLKKIMKMRSI